jgi:ABC-type transport system involved in cytochrome bd biosynthesis fused ATPase/permease subunit
VSVLVLDEPTAHLDAATAEEVTADLLADETRSVVWITHGSIGLDRMDAVLSLPLATSRGSRQRSGYFH